jgi:V8-like Glu-specific endopeptidase
VPTRQTRWSSRVAVRAAGLIAAIVLGTVALTALGLSADAHQATAAVPTATTGALATVGPLYRPGDGTQHKCTASVVHSPHHNVLLTAAHCIRGTAAGYVIAPGYHHGTAPYGRWRVTGVYLDRDWVADRDPRRDFAFLIVAARTRAHHRTDIEDVTGANRLGEAARRGQQVTVAGYAAGDTDDATLCTIPVYFRGAFPAFDCDPFVGGTSGSPWLSHSIQGAAVVGLIGGLHQGGCASSTSYSPPFGDRVRRVFVRATREARGDRAPDAGSDGC